MSPALEHPPGSNAVLIGVSAYEDPAFPPIRAARNSINTMQDLLTGSDLCGWPNKSVTPISNPLRADDLAVQIAEIARETTGVLLVYFAGHGTLSDGGELCLTVTSTNSEHASLTSLAWGELAEILRKSPARTRIVILDCCYSGQPVESLAATDESMALADITHIQGSYTLTATTRNRTAHVPPPEEQENACTSFTAELRDLLHTGIPGAAPTLTLGELYPILRQRLRAKGLPKPNQRGTDTASLLPFTRNRAAAKPTESPKPAPSAEAAPVPSTSPPPPRQTPARPRAPRASTTTHTSPPNRTRMPWPLWASAALFMIQGLFWLLPAFNDTQYPYYFLTFWAVPLATFIFLRVRNEVALWIYLITTFISFWIWLTIDAVGHRGYLAVALLALAGVLLISLRNPVVLPTILVLQSLLVAFTVFSFLYMIASSDPGDGVEVYQWSILGPHVIVWALALAMPLRRSSRHWFQWGNTKLILPALSRRTPMPPQMWIASVLLVLQGSAWFAILGYIEYADIGGRREALEGYAILYLESWPVGLPAGILPLVVTGLLFLRQPVAIWVGVLIELFVTVLGLFKIAEFWDIWEGSVDMALGQLGFHFITGALAIMILLATVRHGWFGWMRSKIGFTRINRPA